LHTAGKIRLFGVIGFLCGGFLTIFIGAITVFVGMLVANPEKWGAHFSAGDDRQLLVIFGILTLIFSLGLTFTLAGIWQIIFARRNKFLVWAALFLIFVVFGGAEIFFALLER
jgi:predicted phage tail protein